MIMHCRKSLLFCWYETSKKSMENFDIIREVLTVFNVTL